MSSVASGKSARAGPSVLWWGVTCVVPSTLFWLAVALGALTHQESVAGPVMALVDRFDKYFVIGVLLVLPLLGGVLGAIGFKRNRILASVVMLLGFGAAVFNILMQSAPSPH